MPLGTLDRSPPPFFRQGTSALNKLLLCSAAAVFLMAADQRFTLTQPLRNAMATALLPVVEVLNLPVRSWQAVQSYAQGLERLQQEERQWRTQLAQQSEQAARGAQLALENTQLRQLLGLQPALTVKSQAAEVLYEAPDVYSRKLFIDRGSHHGVVASAPVINQSGVLGQVTRVYLMTSEVTLLVDKDAAIPVLNARTQHRGAAFGGGEGHTMELRFVAGNQDVKVGDLLSTSGVDGIYPPGLAVARVAEVERRSDSGFARIGLQPAALADGIRHVLVLEPLGLQQPARPAPEPAAAKPGKNTRK